MSIVWHTGRSISHCFVNVWKHYEPELDVEATAKSWWTCEGTQCQWISQRVAIKLNFKFFKSLERGVALAIIIIIHARVLQIHVGLLHADHEVYRRLLIKQYKFRHNGNSRTSWSAIETTVKENWHCCLKVCLNHNVTAVIEDGQLFLKMSSDF